MQTQSNVVSSPCVQVPPYATTPHRPLHVLTLTPFFPSLESETSGCFVSEPLQALAPLGLESSETAAGLDSASLAASSPIASSVIAVSPIHHHRPHSSPLAPAPWVRYPQIPGIAGLSSAGHFLYTRLLPVVSRLLRRHPIDLLHAHAALPCGHAASLLARRLKIPYVVTVHGLDVFNNCLQDGALARSRRRASIAVYRDAAVVICISKKVQHILIEGMPVPFRSQVVYNGADPHLFSPPYSPARSIGNPGPELLVVANLIPSKGQQLIFKAIHRIRSRFPDLRLRIIGDGPDRDRLHALAADLGIARHIEFLGRQSRAAVADAMRRCTVFVLPSRHEGLGCVYLEAMASANPVIGCRGQGIEEIIVHGENGWLIAPDGLEELVAALSLLLASPGLCARLGSAARRTILQGFTSFHQAARLASIYREVKALSRTVASR